MYRTLSARVRLGQGLGELSSHACSRRRGLQRLAGTLHGLLRPSEVGLCCRWFQEATGVPEIEEPNKVAVASADASGAPSVRMVLLKAYDERGFVFYSNYGSRKARELANGKASMCFYWEPLQHQVSFQGVPAAASAHRLL